MVTWQLTIDSANPTRLAHFWAAALDYRIQPPPEGFATMNDYYRSLGIPDDELGETVHAVVQPVDPAAGGPALEAELIGWCRASLAAYKCPRSVDFVDELPRHPTGKLYKRLLKDAYWANPAG